MKVSIRLLGASMGLSILASAGCGDDGNVLGERNSSGGSGAESGSTSTGGAGDGGSTAGVAGASAGTSAGGGSAGTSDSGGSSSGTAGSSSGGAGAGSGGTAANGGSAGTAANGGSAGTAANGGSAGTAGGSGKECVDRTCAVSEACVAYRTVGGAIIAPPDAGPCPPNSHLEGQNCMANFGYQCVAQPGCPAGQVDCTCGMCPPTYSSCRVAATSQWLDPDAELTCELLAP